MTSTDQAIPLIMFGVMFFALFSFFMVQIAQTDTGIDTTEVTINGVSLVRPTCDIFSIDIFGCTAANVGYVFGIMGVSSDNPIILMLLVTPFIVAMGYLILLYFRG